MEQSSAAVIENKKQTNAQNYAPVKTFALNEISAEKIARLKTGIGELDNVLGGGIVPGCLLLLGGEPGIGKSTLALQLASLLPNTIYFSGEESEQQIKLRADRLEIKNNNLRVSAQTNVETIIATALSEKTKLVVVDSIQTAYSAEAEGEIGNITQVRACTAKLMEAAKKNNISFIIIGQVTKDGAVAGPKTLEHLVDTVLYLEGDRFHEFRILRCVKNRFGSTDEVGVFKMEKNGLQEVKNPSAAFLSERSENTPGTAITCLMQGNRPILVEIQALISKTNFGYPQRRASGFDLNRLQVLIGVLTKRAGLPLDSYDVFLNVVGGMSADEPAADLAVILALASGLQNKTLPKGLVAFGEVGLAGEVRTVAQIDRRLAEAKNLALEYAVVPASYKNKNIAGLKIAPIGNVKEVVKKIIK